METDSLTQQQLKTDLVVGVDSCRGGVAKYQYIYEQCGWDPATRDQQVKVSFKFDDGSWMK